MTSFLIFYLPIFKFAISQRSLSVSGHSIYPEKTLSMVRMNIKFDSQLKIWLRRYLRMAIEGRWWSDVTMCDAGSVSVPCSLLSHYHHLDLPLLSLSLFDPGTAATSPSPLLRDVGRLSLLDGGYIPRGGPVK
jgi:hypothetical protein